MELADSGCYLAIGPWHFLELQDSTELGLGAGILFSKNFKLSGDMRWKDSNLFSDSHDLNYLYRFSSLVKRYFPSTAIPTGGILENIFCLSEMKFNLGSYIRCWPI